MSNQPVIALHLGVHKTATTYLQSRLYNSRELLKENGISYVPLGDVRNLVTSKFNQEGFLPQHILEALKPFVAGERMLLSDENIIGGTNMPKDNKIYPNAKERTEKLLEAFAGFEIEIHLTLRSYAAYFVSRYAESLRHFNFKDFQGYYRELDFDTVSWLEAIEAIKAAGAKKIIITDFGDLFRDEQGYLDLLMGKPGIALLDADDNPTTRRAKFSQQGYEVVRFYARHYAPDSAKKIMRLLDNTPQEKPSTPFMPFTEEQQQNMADRYAAELSQLSAAGDGSIIVALRGAGHI